MAARTKRAKKVIADRTVELLVSFADLNPQMPELAGPVVY
jgi:hypothetical protein